jgi:hypothetical protein
LGGEEIAQGLKEALKVGNRECCSNCFKLEDFIKAGHQNFLSGKIEICRKIAAYSRLWGTCRGFELSMNRAAERSRQRRKIFFGMRSPR